MSKFVDLTGQRFGRLLVQERSPNQITPGGSICAYWLCLCDCGNRHKVGGGNLRTKAVLSCGCLQRQQTSKANTKHGRSNSRLYIVWAAMLDRCRNANNTDFHQYGGRGITVAPSWYKFENFLADMGEPARGLTLERKDNDKGYSAGNCRWATRLEQAQNRRKGVIATRVKAELVLVPEQLVGG